jgi:predicted amidohydrolase YtcJ
MIERGGSAMKTRMKGGEAARSDSADLVLLNGKIITVDKNFSIKEAVAVKDGEVVFVGKAAGIRKFIGPETRSIDLQGGAVMPGINDSHVHVDSLGLSMPPFALNLNFPVVKSIAHIAAAVAAKAVALPAGSWIRGNGYNPPYLAECQADPAREPTRWDLDSVSPVNAVALWDFSHHNLWANSKALEMAGITRDTLDPPGGIIVKDAKGEPIGILREAATALVETVLPRLTREEVKDTLLVGIREMNLNGITSFTQPQLEPNGDLVAIYQELFNEGRLTARVTGMILFGRDFKELKTNLDMWKAPAGLDRTWLQFSQIKIMADGIPPTKTAWMCSPYVGGGYGSLTINAPTDGEKSDNLLQMIQYGHAKRWQIGVHGTGDRTISTILDGYESAQRLYPWQKNKRHYIIHDEMINAADIRRSVRLQVAAAMQPYIHKLNADSAASIVGPELAPRDWPFGSVLKAGGKLTFSSDAAATYPDWRKGVQAAVLREGFSGTVNGPDECISREEAIRAYTINGAWQDHMESVKGSIEPGKVADLCVLDRDILTVPSHEIGDISVLMTIVGGKIVCEKSEGSSVK